MNPLDPYTVGTDAPEPDEANPFDPAAWSEALSGVGSHVHVAAKLLEPAFDIAAFMREQLHHVHLGVDLGAPEPCAVLCTEGADGVMHVEAVEYAPRRIEAEFAGEGSALQRAIRNLRPRLTTEDVRETAERHGLHVTSSPRPGAVEYTLKPEGDGVHEFSGLLHPEDIRDAEGCPEWTPEDQANHEEEVLREDAQEALSREAYERISGRPTTDEEWARVTGCPYEPECATCPAAEDDDVCLPHERPEDVHVPGAGTAADARKAIEEHLNPPGGSLNPKDRLAQAEGKTRLDLLEPVAKAATADALANGAITKGYGIQNYREVPISARVYIAAIERHLDAYKQREDYAPDSGVHHLGHIGANVHILLAAAEAGSLVDDR